MPRHVPESRRLTQLVNCVKCHFKVKPFVLRAKGGHLYVECPRNECREKWYLNPGDVK